MPLPAPKSHSYQSYVNGEFKYITLFCTPNRERFLYSDKENLEITLCSKILQKQDCSIMNYGDHFNHDLYYWDARVNSRRFHKSFAMDTLTMTVKGSNEKILFFPVNR